MRIQPIGLIAAGVLLCGCSTTRRFETGNLSSASFDLLKNKESKVRLLDSTKVSGVLSGADSDSIYLTNSGRVQAVPIRNIRSITQNVRRWRGAAQGFGIGFPIGLALGMVFFLPSAPCWDKEESGWCPIFLPYYLLAGAAIGGLTGGIAGAATGAVVGDRDVYKFKHPPKKVEGASESAGPDPDRK